VSSTTGLLAVWMNSSLRAPQGEARMQAMTESGDGFDLAERDLTIRGPSKS
jgi:RecG-like helicase